MRLFSVAPLHVDVLRSDLHIIEPLFRTGRIVAQLKTFPAVHQQTISGHRSAQVVGRLLLILVVGAALQ